MHTHLQLPIVMEEFTFMSRCAFDNLVSAFLESRKPAFKRKSIITQKDYDLFIRILKNPDDKSNGTAKDRHWVKNGFYLRDIGTPENPIVQLMAINSREGQDRAVCPFEHLYDILGKVHSNMQKHASARKMFSMVRLEVILYCKGINHRIFIKHHSF
jgi:hypothetical protein